MAVYEVNRHKVTKGPARSIFESIYVDFETKKWDPLLVRLIANAITLRGDSDFTVHWSSITTPGFDSQVPNGLDSLIKDIVYLKQCGLDFQDIVLTGGSFEHFFTKYRDEKGPLQMTQCSVWCTFVPYPTSLDALDPTRWQEDCETFTDVVDNLKRQFYRGFLSGKIFRGIDSERAPLIEYTQLEQFPGVDTSPLVRAIVGRLPGGFGYPLCSLCKHSCPTTKTDANGSGATEIVFDQNP